MKNSITRAMWQLEYIIIEHSSTPYMYVGMTWKQNGGRGICIYELVLKSHFRHNIPNHFSRKVLYASKSL